MWGFLEEISISNGTTGKDHFHQCEQASCNPLRTHIEQSRGKANSLCSSARTNTLLLDVGTPGSLAFTLKDLQPPNPLGFLRPLALHQVTLLSPLAPRPLWGDRINYPNSCSGSPACRTPIRHRSSGNFLVFISYFSYVILLLFFFFCFPCYSVGKFLNVTFQFTVFHLIVPVSNLPYLLCFQQLNNHIFILNIFPHIAYYYFFLSAFVSCNLC